jgi:hypothetical protein
MKIDEVERLKRRVGFRSGTARSTVRSSVEKLARELR